ncbi:hypothetical protein O3G_MSEX009913 [Manduca sexta]|uniref:Uncharacterized protein n=1 Tax=Manduca sexta TaxID=7130 RepID=A0A922CSQ9_MANSE|nr:hypothetical protein O3G_MSEX009913 [Manduca sexta]
MILFIPFSFLWIMTSAQVYYYHPYNVSRATVPGIAAYRSALTLDWIAAEDSRQRELVAAFETEPAPPIRILTTDCIMYARPASGKIARLMLELLKNLEGDEGTIVTELIQALVRSKLLVETSMLESEPDLEALVKTPDVMMGEPHTTFPRILAMTWLAVTDPSTTKKYGWCPVTKINKYLASTKSMNVAKHMRALEPIVARARYIMEEFIQHVTPLNMYEKEAGKRRESKSRNYKMEGQKENQVTWPSVCVDTELEPDLSEDRWVFRNSKRQETNEACSAVRPTARDIVRRVYAIMPYFDKDHSNAAFLHKLRGTVYSMSEGADLLDREGAFYAAVLSPVVFLQQYRDTWCLLERFHRALRLYQISHPTEKRSALKLLQNLRAVNQKIRSFVFDLPGPALFTRPPSPTEPDDDELYDKKDIKYLKELIKNLG